MGLNESEEDEQDIINYEKNLILVKKMENQIINLFKESFSDKLYKISSEMSDICYGSTRTKDGESYCNQQLKLILEFIDLSYKEEREIRSNSFNIIASFTPFDVRKYMSPIDFKFINYTKKTF